MNKLIIVGNGFDLAHNFPTSYKHFIDDFWRNFERDREKDHVKNVLELNPGYSGYYGYGGKSVNGYSDFVECLNHYCKEHGLLIDTETLKVRHRNNTPVFSFKNEFFRIISQQSINNWVDIENKYYEILKSLVNNKFHHYQKDIIHLNNEFEEIKLLLQEYLKNEIIDKFDFKTEPTDNNKIIELFRVKHKNLNSNSTDSIFLEFPPEDHRDLISFDKKLILVTNPRPHSLFLDFNYTPTATNYVEQINSRSESEYGKASIIKIHGEINSINNPINFGFGDEMDDDYKIIEQTGDNHYLKNIKSFQYMHNSNYRTLLNWIETEKFQVLIFGHSCGISDRTLLNTIFENHNCRSIKIFYHKNNVKDNYTELTHNISRHFNQKKMMRSKLVDKTICTELPQTIRFKKN
ncbi:AbiH family protein [Flavobacterium pedocola]